MSENELQQSQEERTSADPSRNLRALISDAFTAIRSTEVNKSLATVSLDELIGEQISSNGETERSKAAKFDPYSYKPEKKEAASKKPVKKAALPITVDTQRPTKLDRVLAISNIINDVIDNLKAQPVAEYKQYVDMAPVAVPEEEEED